MLTPWIKRWTVATRAGALDESADGLTGPGAPRRASYASLILRVALALILAGALRQGLVALGVLHLDEASLGEARFAWVAGIASAALLACGLLFVVGASARIGAAIAGSWTATLLPAAGALFALASSYAYDPYCQPILRRYSEEGVSGWWIALVVPVCALACLAVRRGGRPGLAIGGLALWWCLIELTPMGWH